MHASPRPRTKARFTVPVRLDGASSAQVVIDRAALLVSVRPCRRRRRSELPLSWVAPAVLHHVVKVELAERRRLRTAAPRGRR